MTNFFKGATKLTLAGRRLWTFETKPSNGLANKTFADILSEERLKRHLKRAVSRDFAPQSLIDSIRSGIRG